MKNHFYGVYIRDSQLAGGLDTIRFLMEPDAIRFSHITVRGPYQRKLSDKRLNEELVPKVRDWKVLLTEPERFFTSTQNTVFLKVDLGQLKSLWHKPDYPEGAAHITLYDGSDRRCAEALYKLLNRHRWDFRVGVSQLRAIDEKCRIDGSLLELLHGFTDAFSKFIGSAGLCPHDILGLDVTQRLELVQRVLIKLGVPVNNRSSKKRLSPLLKDEEATKWRRTLLRGQV